MTLPTCCDLDEVTSACPAQTCTATGTAGSTGEDDNGRQCRSGGPLPVMSETSTALKSAKVGTGSPPGHT